MQQYKAEKVNHVNILSYNLKFNKALGELDELVIKHETDIVCIQECYSKKCLLRSVTYIFRVQLKQVI